MDKHLRLFLFLLVFTVLLSIAGFYHLNSKLDEFKSDYFDFSQTLIEQQNRQEEKLMEQVGAYEREKNDIEKYKMMALETKELVSNSQRPELSNIVKKWRPYTGYIICSWLGAEEKYGSGSGKIEALNSNGSALIMTNKHVVFKNDTTPSECLITFPEIPKIYSLENPQIMTKENMDIGYIVITEPDNNLIKLAASVQKEKVCSSEASPGDSVLALGYPGIGVSGDVTVTDGIISGIEAPFYISTVKLDYGNSGGLAILAKDNCYLGVTTASIAGEIESLAKILRYSDIPKIYN